MDNVRDETAVADSAGAEDEISLLDLALALAEHWKLLIFGPLLAGLTALGVAFVVPPTFTATAVILPPQQQLNVTAAVLQSLWEQAGIAGAAASIKHSADMYVALLKSRRVRDRIIDAFGLMEAYEAKSRDDVRKALDNNVNISVGKKDGLIRIEVNDSDPHRAAAIANGHVEELRKMLEEMVVTEAQQRRRFFEEKLAEANDRLIKAQMALQASGFNERMLRAELRAAAERQASVRAQVVAAEVRLRTMQNYMNEEASEFQQAQRELRALREQLARVEADSAPASYGQYFSWYREFTYALTLLDLFARQYELAKLDEYLEGTLVQVLDAAQPPDRKSKPRRALVAVLTTLVTGFALVLALMIRSAWRNAARDPKLAAKVAQLRQLLHWRGRSAAV